MILNDLNVIFDKVDVLMSDFSKQQNMWDFIKQKWTDMI
jgi:hypothetical protein